MSHQICDASFLKIYIIRCQNTAHITYLDSTNRRSISVFRTISRHCADTSRKSRKHICIILAAERSANSDINLAAVLHPTLVSTAGAISSSVLLINLVRGTPHPFPALHFFNDFISTYHPLCPSSTVVPSYRFSTPHALFSSFVFVLSTEFLYMLA